MCTLSREELTADQHLQFRRLVDADDVHEVERVYILHGLSSTDLRACGNDAIRCAARNQNLDMLRFLKKCGLNENDVIDTKNFWLSHVWQSL